jgi:hypothetical protein
VAVGAGVIVGLVVGVGVGDLGVAVAVAVAVGVAVAVAVGVGVGLDGVGVGVRVAEGEAVGEAVADGVAVGVGVGVRVADGEAVGVGVAAPQNPSGETPRVYCAAVVCAPALVEKTTRSKLVLAGIVVWNVSTLGGEPLLKPGSPRYLAGLLMSAAANGERNTATSRLPTGVPSTLVVRVNVPQTGAPVALVKVWVL